MTNSLIFELSKLTAKSASTPSDCKIEKSSISGTFVIYDDSQIDGEN